MSKRNNDKLSSLIKDSKSDDEMKNEFNKIEAKNKESRKPKVTKFLVFVSMATLVIGGIFGTFIGSNIATMNYENEKPKDIISVKAKSSVYDQLNDMREDLIATNNKQIASDGKDALKNNINLLAVEQANIAESESIKPLIDAIIKSDVKLSDIDAFRTDGNLDDASLGTVKAFLSTMSDKISLDTAGKPSIEFKGSAPSVDFGEHVETVSSPVVSPLNVGVNSSNSTLITYMVTVPVSTANGTLHTVVFVVTTTGDTASNSVTYCAYVGELKMQSPDGLTSAMKGATNGFDTTKTKK